MVTKQTNSVSVWKYITNSVRKYIKNMQDEYYVYNILSYTSCASVGFATIVRFLCISNAEMVKITDIS